jgi:hypothetical protein
MLPSKKFQRRQEDFVCCHCGCSVQGTGYTNHCPRCLWSRHVDINPGDRAATCLGMMEPIGVELSQGDYVLHHRCLICGLKKRNKLAKNDDFEAVLRVMGQGE